MATPLGLVATVKTVIHARFKSPTQLGPLTMVSVNAEKDKVSIVELKSGALLVTKGADYVVIPAGNVASYVPKTPPTE